MPAAPEAEVSVLPRSDGSATYSYAGYTVTASVNGPIEAPRRDEHPYEAVIDVVVRPAAGVGGMETSV
jgi:exosome complex component RRP46